MEIWNALKFPPRGPTSAGRSVINECQQWFLDCRMEVGMMDHGPGGQTLVAWPVGSWVWISQAAGGLESLTVDCRRIMAVQHSSLSCRGHFKTLAPTGSAPPSPQTPSLNSSIRPRRLA